MAASRALLLSGLFTASIALAQDPPSWATAVVSYDSGSTPYSGYTLKGSALGRPTVETYEDFTSTEPTVTVVPVYPPWDFMELVSIGEGGELILEMGKPITNDPAHPYGVDFLVFGNALLSGSGLYDQYGNDPTTYTLPPPSSMSIDNDKWGVVSVSADGVTWFDFPTDQRVGAMLPTLGRVWNGTAWGDPTDPTLPPDPDLVPADLGGMNLADLCERYRGGAGGTGFDLDDLIVPEGQTPPSSFTYVKISVPDDGNSETSRRTEIDAVTVVAPVGGFTRWQQDHFAWIEDPAREAPGASPDGDAFDNWQEYARGGDPVHVQETELFLPSASLRDGAFVFTLPLSAREAPWTLQASSNPADPNSWADLTPQPDAIETESVDQVEMELHLPPLDGDTPALYRLRLEAAP